jgi:molybdopterin-binding protein
MKRSTRNRLPDTTTEVIEGEAAAKVTLQAGTHLVALITCESPARAPTSSTSNPAKR